LLDSQPFAFQVKICGLTQPQQAIDAREAGADAIGLNFYEPSVRYVTPDQAAAIIDAVRNDSPQLPQPAPRVVGVFVNHSIEQIVELATSLNLDGVQLHGDEPEGFFTELKQAISERLPPGSRPFFVRALRTQPNGDQPNAGRDAETARIVTQIRSWSKAGIDMILLDAAATGEFGGTGKSIDWSLMPELQTASDKPLALAGGLNPTNVAQAIQIANNRIVDVASGVESSAGVKCPAKVAKFVQQARQALGLRPSS